MVTCSLFFRVFFTFHYNTFIPFFSILFSTMKIAAKKHKEGISHKETQKGTKNQKKTYLRIFVVKNSLIEAFLTDYFYYAYNYFVVCQA